MGILSRLERGPQASVTGDLWKRILSGDSAGSSAGVRVSEDSAATVSSIFSCVRVASEDIAKLPLILYQRTKGGGKRRAFDHPLYSLLHDRPNDWMTSFEFRQLMQVHLELWGNAFAFINRVGREVRELIPLHPEKVTARQLGNWDMEYEIRGDTRKTRSAKEILHLRGLSLDGIEGVRLRKIAREAIGLALATERYGAKFFANGARASGALKHTGTLSDPAADRLKKSTEEALTGDNLHRILLLEEGMEWQQLTLSAEDSQFLETRKFQVTEIARYFRMQPHKIADLERATFSNIEHQSLEYVTDSLMPRQVRWEQRLNWQLLTDQERGVYFWEFLNDALLRGDTKTRFEAYKTAIDTGWMNPNEARVKENLNPKRGLDEYRRPMNTEPVGTPAPEETAPEEDGIARALTAFASARSSEAVALESALEAHQRALESTVDTVRVLASKEPAPVPAPPPPAPLTLNLTVPAPAAGTTKTIKVVNSRGEESHATLTEVPNDV